MPLLAIIREISPNINQCELSFHAREPIDLARAMAQHKAYQACLAELGAQIVTIPPEPELPDAVFVEDTAVVADEVAVIANPGAPSRRAETRSMAQMLARYRPLKFLAEPATLDGGDIMRIGRTFFVGLSQRTNQEGVAQLRELVASYGYQVQAIKMKGCLHLKSACSYLGRNSILGNRSLIDATPLRDLEWLEVAPDEPAAANALLLNEAIVMPSSFPKTRALLEKRGFRVRAIDVSELQKAEAGVTCCSLIFQS